MTRFRRFILISCVAATAIAGTAATQASADVVVPEQNVKTGTWFCVATDYVAVGMCLDNPLEPIGDRGGVVGIVLDAVDQAT